MFDRIYVEISNICNLQCSFCPEVLRPKKLMSVAFFEKVLSEVQPHTKAITLHVMGEPMAHPHFSEILDLLEAKPIPVILTSNGILIERYKDRLLRFPLIQQINFSVHSFFDNHPTQPITSYLTNLIRFGRDYISNHPKAFVNFRLWNLQDLKSNLSGPNQEIYTILKNHFADPELPSEIQVTSQKSFRLERHFKLHFDTEFEWPTLTASHFQQYGTCKGLQTHVAILANGQVVPCCLDKESVIELGNLANTPFNDILKSERAKNMIKGFGARKLIEPLCQHCTYRTRFE